MQNSGRSSEQQKKVEGALNSFIFRMLKNDVIYEDEAKRHFDERVILKKEMIYSTPATFDPTKLFKERLKSSNIGYLDN